MRIVDFSKTYSENLIGSSPSEVKNSYFDFDFHKEGDDYRYDFYHLGSGVVFARITMHKKDLSNDNTFECLPDYKEVKDELHSVLFDLIKTYYDTFEEYIPPRPIYNREYSYYEIIYPILRNNKIDSVISQ